MSVLSDKIRKRTDKPCSRDVLDALNCFAMSNTHCKVCWIYLVCGFVSSFFMYILPWIYLTWNKDISSFIRSVDLSILECIIWNKLSIISMQCKSITFIHYRSLNFVFSFDTTVSQARTCGHIPQAHTHIRMQTLTRCLLSMEY